MVNDTYSVGLTSNVTAFLGVGTTPINFTLITRGEEPGLYFTSTVNAAIGDGIEVMLVLLLVVERTQEIQVLLLQECYKDILL